MAIHDFSAEHWEHIRNSDPIAATFAVARQRTRGTWNRSSKQTILTVVFRPRPGALKKRRGLAGFKRLAGVIQRERFGGGVREDRKAA